MKTAIWVMLNPISWKKLIKKLHTFGFDGPFSGGRHLFVVRGSLKLHIPNPHGQDISKYLLAELLRQANISHDEWNEN